MVPPVRLSQITNRFSRYVVAWNFPANYCCLARSSGLSTPRSSPAAGPVVFRVWAFPGDSLDAIIV